MKFLSKSQTLNKLKLKQSTVPLLHIFNCKYYLKNKKKTLKTIQKKFPNSKIAVRSSFNSEDTAKSSNAGRYKSFLNIETKNLKNIERNIDDVINSKKRISKSESFFVQKMNSIRETLGVGTLIATPSSFPFREGIISPIAFDAPVDVGTID